MTGAALAQCSSVTLKAVTVTTTFRGAETPQYILSAHCSRRWERPAGLADGAKPRCEESSLENLETRILPRMSFKHRRGSSERLSKTFYTEHMVLNRTIPVTKEPLKKHLFTRIAEPVAYRALKRTIQTRSSTWMKNPLVQTGTHLHSSLVELTDFGLF